MRYKIFAHHNPDQLGRDVQKWLDERMAASDISWRPTPVSPVYGNGLWVQMFFTDYTPEKRQ